jgi:lysozyme
MTDTLTSPLFSWLGKMLTPPAPTVDPWARLKARLRSREEGDIPWAYQDSQGYWTIGVGHLIDKRAGGSLPQSIRDALLDYDIAGFVHQLDRDMPWWRKLDAVRQEVILDMTFNMGEEHVEEFHNTLAAIQAGDYGAAAAGMLASKWASQVGQRAVYLAHAMQTGAFA